jgi:hypothetical protein
MILKKGMLYETGEVAWGRELLAVLQAPTDQDGPSTSP